MPGGAYCRSAFSTPVVVFAPLTPDFTTTPRGSTVTPQTTVIDLVSSVGAGKPTTLASLTTMTTGTKIAESVEIYWRFQYLASFEPTYASSLAKVLKVQVPTATSTRNPTSQQTSQGLTPGAKAGISLGTIFGVIFVALGVYLVFVRARRKGMNSGEGVVQLG
jgi:hypothetical protein